MYGAKIMGESPMTDGSTRWAGSVAVEVLARAGVRRFYTVPGESFLEVLDAVEASRSVAGFHQTRVGRLVHGRGRRQAVRGTGGGDGHPGRRRVEPWHRGCTLRCRTHAMVVLLGHVETHFLGEKRSRRWTSRLSTPRSPSGPPRSTTPTMAEFVERGLRIATSGRPGPVMLLACRHPRREVPLPRHGRATSAPAGSHPEEVHYISAF